MLSDAAPATVNPLGEWLFFTVPPQTGLGQGGGIGVVLVETLPAGACSLAADHLHERPWRPVAHTAREVLLPRAVIQLLAGNVGAVGGQPAGPPNMQWRAVLGQSAVQLGHPRCGPFGHGGALPAAAANFVGANRVEAIG